MLRISTLQLDKVEETDGVIDWSGPTNRNWPVPDNVSSHSLGNPDSEGYLTVRPVTGALDAFRTLTLERKLRISIVSRLDREPEWLPERVRRWVSHWGIDSYIPQNRIHFCYEFHEKRIFCELMRPKFFVDDRLTVLRHLVGVVPHLFLFRPGPEDPRLWQLVEDKKVHWVDSWEEVLATLAALI